MDVVKLRDFFNKNSTIALDTHRKAAIFDVITTKTQGQTTTHTSLQTRSTWYFKTIAGTAFACMAVYILYMPLSEPIIQYSNNLLLSRTTPSGNIAQAGYVGSLLTTQGQINIVRQGVTMSTSQLQGGDIVYLYNTSKANFVLRDGSRGLIEGPAQITIIDHEVSGLVLTVNHARYIQIDKNNNVVTENTTSENLVIETTTSRIITQKDNTVHLALVTTQDRQFIQNKGDALTIESIVPNTASPISKQLASSHIADVTNTIKIYAQVSSIYNELKTQSTTQTFDLDTNELQSDNVRSLLALQQINKNPSTQQTKHKDILAYQAPESSTSAATQTISQTMTVAEESSIPLYNDGNETTSASETIANTTNTQTSQESEPEIYQNLRSKSIDTVLGTTQDDTIATGKQVITLSTTSTVNNKPLNNSQIRSIIELKSDSCPSHDIINSLIGSFSVDATGSLNNIISTIKENYYLTEELLSILNHLSDCNDIKN